MKSVCVYVCVHAKVQAKLWGIVASLIYRDVRKERPLCR